MAVKGGGRSRVSMLTPICLLIASLRFGIASSLAADFGFRFVTWPSWQVVTGGEEVTLRCTTNLPPDSIRWQHNHRFIDVTAETGFPGENRSVRVEEAGDKGSNLVIEISSGAELNRRQEGLYQCVASVGSIAVTSLPGRIEVAYLRAYEDRAYFTQSLLVNVGNVFRVPCEVPESLPEAKLRFYKDGHLLDLSDERKFHVTQTGDLIVLDADESSEGTYSCSAFNHFLRDTTEYRVQTNVSIKNQTTSSTSAPRLLSFDSVVNARIGDRVQLVCVAISSFPSVMHWSRKGAEGSAPLGQSVDKKAVSMVIREVSTNDEGVFRCHGNNSFGSSFADVTLFVQDPPYIMKGAGSQSVSEDASINLECVFGGSPAPTVAWVFNGQLLTSSDNVRVIGNRLELSPVQRSQAGVYQCFGFNPLGSAQDTTVVTVIPKTVTVAPFPRESTSNSSANEREIDMLLESENEEQKKETKKKQREEKQNKRKNKKKFKNNDFKNKGEMNAPTRPNVTKLSDESVMVTWDVEHGQGIPILFFKVQYRTLESHDKKYVNRRWKTIDEDIPAYVKSYEVTGLKANHVYRFRVLAVYVNNDNQPGLSSKTFFLDRDIKLKKPEEAPEILFLLPVDDKSINLFWDYRSQTKTEGFIINYRMSTSAAEYTKITLLGPERRNHVVSHLQPDASYDFKMSSFNMAGTSNFSERKTFHPEGSKVPLLEGVSPPKDTTTTVPIVVSDPEGRLSNRLLYVTLGAGLGVLLLIVVLSYVVYSCRNKGDQAELDPARSKFSDTSLRIHRLSCGDIRQPPSKGCECHRAAENQVPLLAKPRKVALNNERLSPHHSPPVRNIFPSADSTPSPPRSTERKMNNGNVNIMKETSFAGSDQPPNVFRDSLHSTFKD